ncbi:MAG: cupredoxin domain-containing protein [Fidelibacterota bacterium]
MTNKTTSEIIAVVLVLVTTLGVIAATAAYRHFSQPELELLARAPEKGNWYPQTLTVEKGENVTITIRNVDAVTHGFLLPAFDISLREIKGGETETIEFRADKEGTFPFYCAVWCGDYHMQMRGKLVVR